MNFPKVLIFGQPFNDFSGGGITLSNLFRGWPRDKIAVAFIGHGLVSVTTDICNTYYQLGKEEHRWIFPLNIFQRKFESGLKSFDFNHTPVPYNSIQAGIRYKIINRYFYPCLKWTGLFYMLSKISLSERFKIWLKEYKPEILYIQASNRETVNFAIALCDYLRIPSVFHMMDDWPSIICPNGLFSNYWRSKIDSELKLLLSKVTLHFSISEAMSKEYKVRYGISFKHFHNPIDINRWLPKKKKELSVNPRKVVILYSGRIGKNLGICDSLIEVAEAIDFMNHEDLNIRLHIQTPSKERTYLNRLLKHKCVLVNKPVEYEKIPEVFAEADILLLAYDFNRKSVDHFKLSMPTKASEYMISGTPILVYCSEEIAVTNFFRSNECGYCVTKQDRRELIKAINILINNLNLRRYVSNNAVNTAIKEFNALNVKNEFQNLLRQMNFDK